MADKSYGTAVAFRVALEERLKRTALASNVRLDRMRRQVMVERFLARIEAADSGSWVLKGAVALEVRLGPHARATADVDLGLRATATDAFVDALAERLITVFETDTNDFFEYRLHDIRPLAIATAGDIARARINVRLADREFGGFHVDIALRTHELETTDRLRLPGFLWFAGINPPTIEVVSLDRHVAEKFHGMLKQFPDRENTRVRDLVDLVLLNEHGLLDTRKAAAAIRAVWSERGEVLPEALPSFPPSWPDRYLAMVAELDLAATTFEEAVTVVTGLWAEMFPMPT